MILRKFFGGVSEVRLEQKHRASLKGIKILDTTGFVVSLSTNIRSKASLTFDTPPNNSNFTTLLTCLLSLPFSLFFLWESVKSNGTSHQVNFRFLLLDYNDQQDIFVNLAVLLPFCLSGHIVK